MVDHNSLLDRIEGRARKAQAEDGRRTAPLGSLEAVAAGSLMTEVVRIDRDGREEMLRSCCLMEEEVDARGRDPEAEVVVGNLSYCCYASCSGEEDQSWTSGHCARVDLTRQHELTCGQNRPHLLWLPVLVSRKRPLA